VEASKAQMPPVNVEELKHFRELIESLSEELAPPVDSGPAKGSIATDGLQSLVEKVCGPGSNARVLSRRNGVLEMFLRKGYLAPLQTGTDLPGAVLQLLRRFHSSTQIIILRSSSNACGRKDIALRTNNLWRRSTKKPVIVAFCISIAKGRRESAT